MTDDGTFKVSRKAFYDAMAGSPEVRGLARMRLVTDPLASDELTKLHERMNATIARCVAVENAWLDLMDPCARALFTMGVQLSDCLIEHIEDEQRRPVRRVLKVYDQPVMEVLTERTPTGPYSWTVTHTPRFIAWPTLTAPQVRADSMSGET